MGGTGSPRVVYLNGVDFFGKVDESGEALSYVNLQLHQGGFIFRLSKNTNVVAGMMTKESIKDIHVLSREMKIRTKSPIRPIMIVHDALITIRRDEFPPIQLYCLASFYKSFMSFLKKDWIQAKCTHEMKKAEKGVDRGSMTAESVFKMIESLLG